MPGRTGFGFGAKRLLSRGRRGFDCFGSHFRSAIRRMSHGLGSLAIKAEGEAEQIADLHGSRAKPPRENAMADLSSPNYERALDDITQRGISAIRSTEKKVNSAIATTADAARDAVDHAERIQDSVHGAIMHSIKVRPYTTLAIAGLIGFAYGAFRR
jgi:ElaB/YqjD/DUF883 family membrane-anchored ribosome-binding protein